MSFLTPKSVLIFLSFLAAFVSVLALLLPLVKRTEKRKRFENIVQQKRHALYQAAKEELANKGKKKDKKQHSAAQSMAALYKVQQLAGSASKKARTELAQAGIRSPTAPLFYLLSRIVLPLILCSIAMIFLSNDDLEIASFTKFLILIVSAGIGFFLPRLIIKNTADKRQLEISLSFPDALDMMLICVQGGISVEGAINKIAETVAEHSETLAEELGLLSAELAMLNDRHAAFQGFAKRVGGDGAARSFSTAMLQAEQYGTSISKALRILANEQRDQRMALAEQKAASLPPKLTVPMILFFLPALFVTILGPAFISSQ